MMQLIFRVVQHATSGATNLKTELLESNSRLE